MSAMVGPLSDVQRKEGVKIDDGFMTNYRERIYEASKRIMLVHTLYKSANAAYLFDTLTYCIPHKGGSLAEVTRVEYFLGRHWQQKIFTVETRYNGFAIKVVAYGTFLCTARVHFSDGAYCKIYRYVDFEMGSNAAIASPAEPGPLTHDNDGRQYWRASDEYLAWETSDGAEAENERTPRKIVDADESE